MANERLVETYAQAIFEQALANWLEPLKAINAGLTKDGAAEKLDDVGLAFTQKQPLLQQALPQNVSGEVRNFVSLLASKNQIPLLPDIIAEFERYVQRGPAGLVAQVTSAVALTDSEKGTLEKKMCAQFGDTLTFNYTVDPAILGGVIVRIGDKVIDGSVAGKLAALQEKLK